MENTSIFWVVGSAIVIGILGLVTYYVISLPMRRRERARFLFDVIESALEQGTPVERHIISISQTRDSAIGVHFHLLAAYLERGSSLTSALEKVPQLLPPQALAMLKTSETMGGYQSVLPACRNLLDDGTSQTRVAINYQVVFAFLFTPVLMLALPFIVTRVFPVFTEILSSFNLPMPFMTKLMFKLVPWIFCVQLITVAALCACAAMFLGGARFQSWLESGLVPVFDRIHLSVPWRRKRLQRDFSVMLALLLDSGVAEERAVLMAAKCTANAAFFNRARKTADELRNGVKLSDALQRLDDSGEFCWRLDNAAHSHGGFFKALKGWQDSLDASAFQQEQAAAQTISTALLLLNGLTVAIIATGFFMVLNSLNSFIK